MLLPIFLVVLVDVFALTLVIPLLAIYAEHFGASALEATLLVSTFAVCQLVSGPLLGRASDRVGRKPMLLVSQLGTFVGLLVMASARSLWMLYLARVIDGATAGNLSLAQAYIADNTAPEDRARSFARVRGDRSTPPMRASHRTRAALPGRAPRDPGDSSRRHPRAPPA